jgi:hypothetical protein
MLREEHKLRVFECRQLREISVVRGIGKLLIAGDCIVGRFMISTAD